MILLCLTMSPPLNEEAQEALKFKIQGLIKFYVKCTECQRCTSIRNLPRNFSSIEIQDSLRKKTLKITLDEISLGQKEPRNSILNIKGSSIRRLTPVVELNTSGHILENHLESSQIPF